MDLVDLMDGVDEEWLACKRDTETGMSQAFDKTPMQAIFYL